jgi:hypothetical protein
MAEPPVSSPAIYQLRASCSAASSPLVWRHLLVHGLPAGDVRTVVAARAEGLLTTASDERSENGPFSAVGCASAPPRVVRSRAVARKKGSITPQSRVRRPYEAPGRRNHKSPEGPQTGTNAKAPVGSKLWRDAQNRQAVAFKAPSASGQCNSVSSIWSASRRAGQRQGVTVKHGQFGATHQGRRHGERFFGRAGAIGCVLGTAVRAVANRTFPQEVGVEARAGVHQGVKGRCLSPAIRP